MSLRTIILAAASFSLLAMPVAMAEPPQNDPAAHGFHKPSPAEMAAWHAQICKDRYAHEVGRLAYLEAALSITDAQRGAFGQWRDAKLSAAKSHSDACLAHMPMPGHFPDAVQRNADEQKKLEARLAGLQAEQPTLVALFQALTPEQKKLFDREDHHGFDGHHGGRPGDGFGPRFGARHDGSDPGAPG